MEDIDIPEIRYVVVYGTLRPGCGASHKIETKARHVRTVRLPGRIYSLGPFPGVRLADPGVYSFVGDVFEIQQGKEKELLQTLDAYEGYREDDPGGSFYVRKTIDLPSVSGESTLHAYIYEFNRDIASDLIRSGDWTKR